MRALLLTNFYRSTFLNSILPVLQAQLMRFCRLWLVRCAVCSFRSSLLLLLFCCDCAFLCLLLCNFQFHSDHIFTHTHTPYTQRPQYICVIVIVFDFKRMDWTQRCSRLGWFPSLLVAAGCLFHIIRFGECVRDYRMRSMVLSPQPLSHNSSPFVHKMLGSRYVWV